MINPKPQKKSVEIDLTNNCLYIVGDGELTPVEAPVSGFGEQIAVWVNGKVDRIEIKTIKKI
ncbi:DUF3954 domain-containing protein [Bacillaceae bacterium IKA-2]|nr:DUF3954 domain-containing protein [Bacillaceae bacterium IKA-2]